METSQSGTYHIIAGQTIAGRYKILRSIGRGGMANVYLAEDLELENLQVAIKVLHQEFSENRDYVERFLREVELMRLVNHPNVIRTFQGGSFDGLLFFTLEFIDGHSLESILQRRAFDRSSANSFITQICEGLRAIHDRDILHRDLKPGNIMVLPNGQLKITDFGVARPKISKLTKRNQKVGSVLYMAPEVWAGRELTTAVDFYALGVMLYELWTYTLPFNGKNPPELMNKHLKQRVQPPRELNPDIPIWLDRLILALLEKSPNKRPKSSQEIIDYLSIAAGSNSTLEVTPLVSKGSSSKSSLHPKKKKRVPISSHRKKRDEKVLKLGLTILGVFALVVFYRLL